MTNTKTSVQNLKLNEKHRSDGSELIPSEVQASIRQDEAQLIEAPVATTGYTVDDEGLINNYAIESDPYPSDYPSPAKQRRYLYLGAGAALFVVILVLISFAIS